MGSLARVPRANPRLTEFEKWDQIRAGPGTADPTFASNSVAVSASQSEPGEVISSLVLLLQEAEVVHLKGTLRESTAASSDLGVLGLDELGPRGPRGSRQDFKGSAS